MNEFEDDSLARTKEVRYVCVYMVQTATSSKLSSLINRID